MSDLKAPYPYFGGKSLVKDTVWSRLGRPKHYIEPFCGSAAILLAAPEPASLEVISDANGFIANFWRATKCQPEEVAKAADYPVSHVDLGARHVWLMEQRERVAAELQDANWPGDAKVAGWWLWGQCCWIGSGWCDWTRERALSGAGEMRHLSSAGQGIAAIGKIPHAGNAGRGIQASGQVVPASVAAANDTVPELWTSAGRVAWVWLRELAARLERVRVVHGNWDRCLNSHYGGADTAVFLDPPYLAYEKLYGVAEPVAKEVADWARDNAGLRIALCGHIGDYDLPGWEEVVWSRGRLTYGGGSTTDKECIWFSPPCLKVTKNQGDLFAKLGT